jgi:hypothetical protein
MGLLQFVFSMLLSLWLVIQDNAEKCDGTCGDRAKEGSPAMTDLAMFWLKIST